MNMKRIGNNSGVKSSKAELQRRLSIIMELLSKKLRRSEIIEYCMENEDWDITPQTIGLYINRAKGEITKSVRKSAMQNLAESVMDLKELYRAALKKEEYGTCLRVRKELNSVLEVSRSSTLAGEKDNTFELNSEIEDMIKDVTPSRKSRAKGGSGE